MRTLKKFIGRFLSACIGEYEVGRHTSILGRHIPAQIKAGNLKIFPHNPARIKEGTIDLTAGGFYYKENDTYDSSWQEIVPIHNPADPNSRLMWQEAHSVMKPLPDTCHEYGIPYVPQENISKTDPVLLIPPGGYVLLASEEFVSCSPKLELWIAGKSSYGRQRISVVNDMTYCDPGFSGRITFCIRNPFSCKWFLIGRGWPIAQVSLRVGLDTGKEAYGTRGKYHTAGTFEEMMRNWTPPKMLPKMWKDFEGKQPVSVAA